MGGRFLSRNNDLDIEKAYAAMILTPTLEDAVDLLKLQDIPTTVGVLDQLRRRDRDRYEERRNELAPLIEGRHANNLLSNAELSAAVIRLAIEKTQQLLAEGKVQDPSRVARDLSQVATQSVDKRLALQGRPTQITEHRDIKEIVRGLEALKVIQVVDSTAEEDES